MTDLNAVRVPRSYGSVLILLESIGGRAVTARYVARHAHLSLRSAQRLLGLAVKRGDAVREWRSHGVRVAKKWSGRGKGRMCWYRHAPSVPDEEEARKQREIDASALRAHVARGRWKRGKCLACGDEVALAPKSGFTRRHVRGVARVECSGSRKLPR